MTTLNKRGISFKILPDHSANDLQELVGNTISALIRHVKEELGWVISAADIKIEMDNNVCKFYFDPKTTYSGPFVIDLDEEAVTSALEIGRQESEEFDRLQGRKGYYK